MYSNMPKGVSSIDAGDEVVMWPYRCLYVYINIYMSMLILWCRWRVTQIFSRKQLKGDHCRLNFRLIDFKDCWQQYWKEILAIRLKWTNEILIFKVDHDNDYSRCTSIDTRYLHPVSSFLAIYVRNSLCEIYYRSIEQMKYSIMPFVRNRSVLIHVIAFFD